jgi:DNA-binding LytR/AlgR family response regulator
VDYLLKPIEFCRFLMAVNKLKQSPVPEVSITSLMPAAERAYLFFNVSKKKVKIYLDEILYIESLKEYIRIYTKSKNILTKFQLGQIEELLAKNNFLRVHRSFIVARDKIEAFTATDVEVNGKPIPIGRSYKELVQSILEKSSG